MEWARVKRRFLDKGYKPRLKECRSDYWLIQLVRDRRFRHHCPLCRTTRLRVHRTRRAFARDEPVGLTTRIEINYPALTAYCAHCEKHMTFRPDMIHPTAQATRRYMAFISAMCQDQPAQAVADKFGHSVTTVCDWDKRVLLNQLPPPDLNRIRVLLVDEKAVRRRHHYVTVAMNGDTRELIFMKEGKKKETLLEFINQLNTKQKARIQAVGMDRGGAYLAAVKEGLPQAAVVFDKFHLIQNLNRALDEIRRDEYQRALKSKSPTAHLIKGQRFNLYRLPENRTEAQSLRLQELLDANQNLSMAHLLSEQLRLLWDYQHRGYAERYLRDWVAWVEESDLQPMIRFARGLWRDREHILSYIRYGITTGPLEAFNGTIERILRRSCGMRDLDYLFLKIRQETVK
jgi:transposase